MWCDMELRKGGQERRARHGEVEANHGQRGVAGIKGKDENERGRKRRGLKIKELAKADSRIKPWKTSEKRARTKRIQGFRWETTRARMRTGAAPKKVGLENKGFAKADSGILPRKGKEGAASKRWAAENKGFAKANSRISPGKKKEETGRTRGGDQKSGASKMQGSPRRIQGFRQENERDDGEHRGRRPKWGGVQKSGASKIQGLQRRIQGFRWENEREDAQHRGRRPKKWGVKNIGFAKADSGISLGDGQIWGPRPKKLCVEGFAKADSGMSPRKTREETSKIGGGVQKSSALKIKGSPRQIHGLRWGNEGGDGQKPGGDQKSGASKLKNSPRRIQRHSWENQKVDGQSRGRLSHKCDVEDRWFAWQAASKKLGR